MKRVEIKIRGIVQGVGFRPYVFALANQFNLSGWVLNDAEGVLLEVEGNGINDFYAALTADPPPLARIDAMTRRDVPPRCDSTENFNIRPSRRGDGPATVGVAPDAAPCPACLAELFDPTDRRHRYPFINCAHCGPRYAIARRLPYDRPNTSMAAFALCPHCAHEYADPTDRRFHAQPLACPVCGPRLSHSITEICARLRAGDIVAIKGVGGFHLACDARNAAAVDRLRRRKQRNGKPFAVMVASAAVAATVVDLDDDERAALESPARPIIAARLSSAPQSPPLAVASLAPGLTTLGVASPSSPLHYLLFHELAGRPDGTAWLAAPATADVLAMTSANPGGEPLVVDDAEAARRLTGIADLIVGHDREIAVRIDDSVMRKTAGGLSFIRRARGFAPRAIKLARPLPPLLATGGDLKNAVCAVRGDEAFLSQHVGDLDNAATADFLAETVDHLLRILEITPQAVARDRHPDFHSSRFADIFAAERGLPVLPVQHHHAHAAAVLAEHRIEGPALALALDGYGMGDSPSIGKESADAWGGEMLALDGAGGYARIGSLAPLAMPGGDVAARQPWRMAAAALHKLGRGDEIPRRFADCPQAAGVRRLLEKDVHCPPTNACGRWFDAACGLLGVRLTTGYEAEAAMALEALVGRPCPPARLDRRFWRIDAENNQLDLSPLLERLLTAANPADGATLFHSGLIAALAAWTLPTLRARGLDFIVLSGGCLINAVLADGLRDVFAVAGVRPLFARQAPVGDGGLALGQAWAAGLALS